MDYETKIKVQGGGHVIDRYDQIRRSELNAKLVEIRKQKLKYAERLTRNENDYKDLKSVGKSKSASKLKPQIEEDKKVLLDLISEEKEIRKELLSWDTVGKAPAESFSHITQDPGFSIGDYVGRMATDKERQRFTFDKYNDTYSSEFLAEGEEGDPQDLTDYINSEDTKTAKMMDILGVPTEFFDDDNDALTLAFDSNHARHNINAENKKALELLITDKDSNIVDIDPSKLNEVINNNLVSKAKPYTEIWTNNTGFTKLDLENNGVPLIKKNSNGDFVYKEKYLVREFDNEILPDSENGSPVLIGDFKHIIKFIESTPRILQQDNVLAGFGTFVTLDRFIKQIKPYIMDSSNDSYILGYLKSENTNQS